MKQKLPDLKYEKSLWKKGFLVIGIDEVGRGCLAGPLTVGAVCFPILCDKKKIMELEQIGINDSKKLTYAKRVILSKFIKTNALAYSTATINVALINRYGISKATAMAVRKVINTIMQNVASRKKQVESRKQRNIQFSTYYQLPTNYYLLADAFYIKYVKGIGLKRQKAIIHGDGISISIAAASIIAKVERDGLMTKLSGKHPEYKWHKNKGYGTRDHIEALKKYGKTKYHRELYIRKIFSFPNT